MDSNPDDGSPDSGQMSETKRRGFLHPRADVYVGGGIALIALVVYGIVQIAQALGFKLKDWELHGLLWVCLAGLVVGLLMVLHGVGVFRGLGRLWRWIVGRIAWKAKPAESSVPEPSQIIRERAFAAPPPAIDPVLLREHRDRIQRWVRYQQQCLQGPNETQPGMRFDTRSEFGRMFQQHAPMAARLLVEWNLELDLHMSELQAAKSAEGRRLHKDRRLPGHAQRLAQLRIEISDAFERILSRQQLPGTCDGCPRVDHETPDLVVTIEEERRHRFQFKALIVEVRLAIHNTTNRRKEIHGYSHRWDLAGQPAAIQDLEVMREARRLEAMHNPKPNTVEPGDTVHAWTVLALPDNPRGGVTEYEIRVTDEAGDEFGVKRAPRPRTVIVNEG